MKIADSTQLAADLSNLDFKKIEPILVELDTHLILRSYLDGYSLSETDTKIWLALRSNRVAYSFLKRAQLVNLVRWFTFVECTHPEIQADIKTKDEVERAKKTAASKAGGSYNITLPDTDKGVVTRFLPEPSGYLHIGHVKAALLNDYFAHELYKGKLILRFDDTNPLKEKQEFQDAIVEDLELMGIKPDKTSYTSDYFQTLYEYAIRMIKEGHAYADDSDRQTMKQQRWDGLVSARRDRPVHENLAMFEEMKQGTHLGKKHCLRAKISIDNPNKAMRDPVMFRCPNDDDDGNAVPHHRTGTTWKMYPTYDFACPIVDSVEGLTHALRTTEYADRKAQYQWFLDILKLRQVHVWEFSRMNFVRVFLSKRKLTKMVDAGKVWGWDDPRMPTIRGVRRRGMTIPALRDFVLKQGPSRNIVVMDWTNFWASNKKIIDAIAPRHTAVHINDVVRAKVYNAPENPSSEEKPKQAKNPSVGMKKVIYSQNLLFDQVDVALFQLDEEITLMNWGNAIVRKINGSNPITDIELELHLEGDVKKTDKKVTWLSKDQSLVPAELYTFDYLITKDILEEDDNWEDFLNPDSAKKDNALCDCNLIDLKVDDIIQLERKGYYRVDKAADKGKPAVLFEIPTGKTK